jgi:hypothetical protein
VTIDLTKSEGLEPYDVVKGLINWPAHFGRPLEVIYEKSDEKGLVAQSDSSRSQFSAAFPKFEKYVDSVLATHESVLHEISRHWKWKATRAVLWMIGQNQSGKELERKLPGEFGRIAVVIGDEELASPILTGLIEGRGKSPASHDSLLSIRLESSELFEKLPAAIAASILKAGQRDRLSAEVLIFHTHPGAAAPLSRADQGVLEYTAKTLAREFPYISFHMVMVMVAAAKLDQQGDLLFTKELVVPASARLSDLLGR